MNSVSQRILDSGRNIQGDALDMIDAIPWSNINVGVCDKVYGIVVEEVRRNVYSMLRNKI